MMEMTTATSHDLHEMVELLKSSLGEGLIPKSEAYFKWKHFDNPFGASKILLAKEEGKIVGLRAFMQWQWVRGNENIRAVRAVDTATHPSQQGKGIFRTLTMKAVEDCMEEGISLVFNTPNPISMQGYLKMGWHSIGKMPILIAPGSIAPGLFKEGRLQEVYKDFAAAEAIEALDEDWKISAHPHLFHTPLSKKYLQWRYRDCPILNYGAIIEPGAFGMVFRVKKINRFIELRICELWTEKQHADKKARKALRRLISKIRPALVTCGPSPLFETDKKRPLGLFGPFRRGPVTTLRPLALQNLNHFNQFQLWHPSIGSMELF
jgi:N-acetylglutamate synthase-like GNAT family acetyltransferase